MKDVAVVAYCRTGIARAVRGALNQTHGIPLAAHVLQAHAPIGIPIGIPAEEEGDGHDGGQGEHCDADNCGGPLAGGCDGLRGR